MKAFVASLLFVCLALCVAVDSQASVLGDGLTFNGLTDRLEDDSVGLFEDEDTSGTVSAGDLIKGVIQIGKVFRDDFTASGTDADLDSVFAVYSLEVLSVSGTRVTLGAASGSDNVVSIATSVGLSDLGISVADAATAGIVVVEKAANVSFNAFNATGGFVSGGEIASEISSANGYVTDMILGFDGIDDFHDLELESATYTSLATLAGLVGTGTTIAEFRAAYTILESIFSVNFNDVTVTDFGGSTVTGDIVTFGNTEIAAPSGGEFSRGWLFSDDGDFLINPAPEPSSLILWGSLALLGASRRKR